MIDNPVNMEGVELDAFMNEPVMVTVLSGGKDNEALYVQVAVNGAIQMFKRDTPIVVKRKYTERLARRRVASAKTCAGRAHVWIMAQPNSSSAAEGATR